MPSDRDFAEVSTGGQTCARGSERRAALDIKIPHYITATISAEEIAASMLAM